MAAAGFRHSPGGCVYFVYFVGFANDLKEPETRCQPESYFARNRSFGGDLRRFVRFAPA
jgi:hypothetical protein